MRRLRFHAISLLFVLVGAKLQAQRVADPAALHAPRAMATPPQSPTPPPSLTLRRSSNTMSMLRDVSVPGDERIRRAAVGAGVGFLGGLVIGSEIASRCRPAASARCTSGRRRLNYAVGFGLLGMVVGGAIGASTAEQ